MKNRIRDNREKMLRVVMLGFYMLIITALFSHSASSMGVGPSSQHITFAPGQEIQDEIIIINNEKKDFKAGVYPQGEMSDIITVDRPLVDVSAGDTAVSVPFTITFPAESPKPGEHRVDLVVRQFPSDTDIDEGTVISATMAYVSKIIIKVPYPGKYAEGKLYISNTEDMDTPARFVITLYNFGTEPISKAHASIDIIGPTFEKVASFNTDSTSVNSKEEGRLEALWTPEVPRGFYTAAAKIEYDEKEIGIEQNFELGRFLINVSDISVKKFTLGEVAKFNIELFNSWNKEIKDVYVDMSVEDPDGKKMTESKTAAIDIPAQDTGKLEAYWYTEGVMPCIYTVKLNIHYAGKLTQTEYEFEVGTNSIKRIDDSIVGQAVTQEDIKEMSTQGLIILLIVLVLIIIVVMNIVWFYVLTKKLKGVQK